MSEASALDQQGSCAPPWASEPEHRLVEAGALGEEGGMHAELVFGAAERGDPADDDLALPERQMALVEEGGAPEALEQPFVPGERGEERERRHAGRHDASERGLDLRWKGRFRGQNAG